ncbi:similar to DNA repair protein rad9 [Botrytis cinerea T4]|uniref:DNA repair protein rad9 n=1 Tax=Botryotinia fuckeliana (strain T4) TaxID=999810 RepID=G2YHP1_BOTF4|nr:similar to DNA repair protein rad9 [Botrytis cinerea T4]
MAILTFTLNPDALGKFHDALVCLGKFSETVSIEATHSRLILTTLNSTKSAYASFTLVGNKFFSKYQYTPLRNGRQTPEKFSCKIYNKALLAVFKGRIGGDVFKEKDTAIEKCDVSIEDGDGATKSRFIVKILCRHGVLKIYRLNFEAVPPLHALFSSEAANNSWSISSKTLREFAEHFGPGTEQLDIFSLDGRITDFSVEVLKQPLRTTIAVETLEFVEFTVEEQLHIVISVKDFKSIIAHAGISNTNIRALYSNPSSPMQLTYSEGGMQCEFILMTTGEARATSATPAINGSRAASRKPVIRQPLEAASSLKRTRSGSEMAAPVGPNPSLVRENTRRKASRPSPPPPQPSIQSQALFMPANDDDRRWDPVDYEDEDNEMLLWDATADESSAGDPSRRLQETQNKSNPEDSIPPNEKYITVPTQRVAPTQRLSQEEA